MIRESYRSLVYSIIERHFPYMHAKHTYTHTLEDESLSSRGENLSSIFSPRSQ